MKNSQDPTFQALLTVAPLRPPPPPPPSRGSKVPKAPGAVKPNSHEGWDVSTVSKNTGDVLIHVDN